MSHTPHRSAHPASVAVPPHRRPGSRPTPPADASVSNPMPAAAPSRYLNNDEAAAFLGLSPRTLEKQRVIGGGPRFRKFGRRVMYALSDLQAWADARCFETTFDPEYLQRHPGGARDDR